MKGTQVSVTSGISSLTDASSTVQAKPMTSPRTGQRRPWGWPVCTGTAGALAGCAASRAAPGCRGRAVGCSSHGGRSVCVRRGPCAPPGARGGHCPCCGRAWPLAAVPARSSWSQLCGPAGPCHSLPLRTVCAGLCPGPFLSGLWAAVHGGHPVWVETPQSADCVTVPDGPCGSLEREC